MATREERINLVIAAQNRTSAELKNVVADLGKVEKRTDSAARSQKRLGRITSAASNEAAGAMNAMAGRAGALGSALSSLGPGAMAAAAGVDALLAVLGRGTMSAAKWDTRLRRTAALISATGQAAGISAKDLAAFAKARDLATLGDRNEVMDAINILQTFKSVQGEVFREAIIVAQDMSATFGQSLTSSVTMLGKALEDPVRGMTALRRVGVSLNTSEKELIVTLVEAGREAEAQAEMLGVLQRQVGGAAEAEAGGLAGSIDTLNYRWRELLESMGQTEKTAAAVDELARALEDITWTVKDLRGAFTLDEELEQLEKALKNKRNLIREIETEGVDLFGLKDWALGGHREELVEMERQLAALRAEKARRERDKPKPSQTPSSTDVAGDTPDPVAVAKAATSLARLNTEIARMTMTDRKFDEFQLEQRIERFGKVLGKTNPKLREFRRLAQERIDAKYAPKQPAPGMDDHPFSARKDAENAAFAEALARQKKELAAFDREYTRVTQGETALAEEAARAQAEAWERAGADRLQVQEWLSAKLEGVEEQRLAASREAADGMTRALSRYVDEASNWGAQMETFVGGSLHSLEDQLVNVTTTGKFAWRDMVSSMAADLSRMLIQQQITGPLAAYMGGSSASAAGGMVAMIASLFHSGGVVGEGGMSRGVSPAAFVGAPRYHSGGIAGLAPDEVPAILRKREEVLTKDDPRHRDNLRPASTEPPQVNVRVVNVVDEKDTAAGYLGSAEGERTVMNIIRKNRQTLREIV